MKFHLSEAEGVLAFRKEKVYVPKGKRKKKVGSRGRGKSRKQQSKQKWRHANKP